MKLALALLTSLALSSGPAAAADPKRPNFLFILVDDQSPFDLKCYNPQSPLDSPHIDRLAREGVLFERAYTSSTFTGEAVAALFSGVWPMENPQGSGWYARPDPGRDAWPAFFRRAGYATGHFANSPIMNTPGFNEGFDQFSCLVQTFG